jgi:hypothetical protein
MATLSALSTEYLRYQVTATVGGNSYNPTSDTIQFAFPLTGVTPVTWYSGTWEAIAGSFYARILVGPSSGVISLASGSVYDVYIKITDSPEIPVRKVSTITVS